MLLRTVAAGAIVSPSEKRLQAERARVAASARASCHIMLLLVLLLVLVIRLVLPEPRMLGAIDHD